MSREGKRIRSPRKAKLKKEEHKKSESSFFLYAISKKEKNTSREAQRTDMPIWDKKIKISSIN